MDIKFFAKRVVVYTNRKHLGGLKLKERDKVYLLRQNIKTKRPSSKLDHKKLGLFKIKWKTRLVNYKLDLLASMRIHLVFYILLLELAPPNTKTVILDLSNKNKGQEYIVEKVVDKRTIDREH